MKSKPGSDRNSGELRIGDHWNAITIIALSQSNPLKAVAEFVENSIDAKARHITITRGKENGVHFLRIKDDGEGIRKNAEGIPDFHHVATHVCDSIKRQLKRQGAEGLQGEFGIGLLSFWTVGEHLFLSSGDNDGKTHQMHMQKGQPTYRISQRKVLFAEGGTELTVKQILPGIKQFSGEKIQWYLASELRDRIRHSGVQIRVIDRTARAEFKVEPRQFEGRLLHELPPLIAHVRDLYLEIYLIRHDPEHRVGLYRGGTRVLDQVTQLFEFQRAPWNSGYLQGIIDAGNLNLTPGTRLGVIQDAVFSQLLKDLEPVETVLIKIIEDQQRAEEEQASRDVLRCIQKALKEALLVLPAEEYDWFNVRAGEGRKLRPRSGVTEIPGEPLVLHDASNPTDEDPAQKQFFEFAGPLFSVKISPASSVVPVEGARNLRAIPRDRAHHLVEEGVGFDWKILEGEGSLENARSEVVAFRASKEPGLVRMEVTVTQRHILCRAQALLTVTDSLLPPIKDNASADQQGIPSYTFQKAPGELWRSRYQGDQNVVVINNGHRDFVFASRSKGLKLRYICRLFSKELVLKNFVGLPADQVLERLIELSLYTEEHL